MVAQTVWILGLVGLVSGILAGFLGIGGGVLLVPALVSLGYTPLQAVATSSLTIVITSLGGSFQNWQSGYLDPGKIIPLAIPSLVTAQLGVYLAQFLPRSVLLIAFAILLILNIFLTQLKLKLAKQNQPLKPVPSGWGIALLAGAIAGVLAGLFGVGGGVVLVPLQMLFLGTPIKTAIQTSLAVIVVTALSACVGHALQGNVVWGVGITLGMGGVVGSTISSRFLPKLSDRAVTWLFSALLVTLAIYMASQAFN